MLQYSVSSFPHIYLMFTELSFSNTIACYALIFVAMSSNMSMMACFNFCPVGGIEMTYTMGSPIQLERDSSPAITWKTVPNNAFTSVSMLAKSTRHGCINFMDLCCIEMMCSRRTPPRKHFVGKVIKRKHFVGK